MRSTEKAVLAAVKVKAYRRDTRAWLRSLPYDEARAEVADLLNHGIPVLLRGLRVEWLLCYCPRVGSMRATEWLKAAGIPERTDLGDLTEDQRGKLSILVRGGSLQLSSPPCHVTNDPLREAFLRGTTPLREITEAYSEGASTRNTQMRVRRMLGLSTYWKDGHQYTQRSVSRANALKLADALGLAPVEIGL